MQGVFLADKADMMLGYCSGSADVIRDVPGLVSVALPPDLTVGPAYGLTVLTLSARRPVRGVRHVGARPGDFGELRFQPSRSRVEA